MRLVAAAPLASLVSAVPVLRVRQWAHFCLLPLAATAAPGAERSLGRLALAVLAAAGCLAYAYALNAWTDREGDLDAVKNPLVGAVVPPLLPWLIAGCGLAGLLGGLVLGLGSLLAAAVSVVAATVYSAGPRLKARPLVGSLVNDAVFVPLLFLGSATAWPPPAEPQLVLAFLVLLTQNQLVHELADLEEDVACGTRTTAGVAGPNATRGLCLTLGVAAALLLFAVLGVASLPAGAVMLGGGLLTLSATCERTSRVRRLHRYYSLATGAALFALALLRGHG